MAEGTDKTWHTVEEARDLPGIRLVLTAGVPGPWGEAAKAVLTAKGLTYVRVRQDGGRPNEALRAWTGQDNAPQIIVDGEPPRSGWHEILELAERLAPDPPLVPNDAGERTQVLGLAAELCGAAGFGWQRRLMLLQPLLSLPREQLGGAAEIPEALGRKYGYDARLAAEAPARCAQTLDLFSDTLRTQRAKGRRFLVGEALSAADLYWAAFAAMVEPLPAELCPMPEGLRAGYTIQDTELRARCDPALLDHREAIYREVIGLPVEL